MAMAPPHERGGPGAAQSRLNINHDHRSAAQPNDTLIVHGPGALVDLEAARARRRHRGDWWPRWALLLLPSWFEDRRSA
jgi:hypothetical protein